MVNGSDKWSRWSVLILFAVCLFAVDAQGDPAEEQRAQHGLKWKRTPKLVSRWVEEMSLATPFPEYPRPQLVRDEWLNLNGPWDFLGEGPQPPELPSKFTEQALVPSATQAVTSCLAKEWTRGWYRKKIEIPAAWQDKKVLLHFEAVGGAATVVFNGRELGKNTGTFKRFSFELPEITAGKPHEIVVHFDDTDPRIPRGKPEHVSGLWQTVWLEPVPADHIRSFQQTPDIDAETLSLDVELGDATGSLNLVAIARADGRTMAEASGPAGETLVLKLDEPRLWSPEDPFLYDLVLELRRGEATIDRVESYFGMRKISTGEVDGVPRILLNNEVYYQAGLLDQGTWPDSYYTPPSDKCLKWEIETAKDLGFNVLRKHVKIEASRWYYWCDKLGMLVWQDLPSQMYFNGRDFESDEDKQFARDDLDAMIEQYYNHPSIVSWVIFNETWGQFDPREMTIRAKRLDTSRLINATSHVWPNEHGRRRYTADYYDEHCYERHLHFYDYNVHLPAVFGEFGGIAYKVEGNTEEHENYRGYGPHAKSAQDLLDQYKKLVVQAARLRDSQHVCAIIYTELTDFYHEINGFITFDREVVKVDADELRKINMLFRDPSQR